MGRATNQASFSQSFNCLSYQSLKLNSLFSAKSTTANALLLVVFLSLLTMPSQTLADEEYRFERMWPTLQQPWYFSLPQGITVAPDGSVYVADSFDNRTQNFAPAGQFVMKWGSFATEDGEFVFPLGMAIDSNAGVIPS